MINIIGGKFKRKKILVPENEVRPTSAIKREAIFSILESYALKNSFDLYTNKCFIDLFSGSGALGLEAVSRGASFCYFYEINNNVIKILKKNCKSICHNNEYKIFQKNLNLVNNFNLNFSLSSIFIDPPYKYKQINEILSKILHSKIMNKNTIIVIETDRENNFNFSSNFNMIKSKIYGKTKLFFLKIL